MIQMDQTAYEWVPDREKDIPLSGKLSREECASIVSLAAEGTRGMSDLERATGRARSTIKRVLANVGMVAPDAVSARLAASLALDDGRPYDCRPRDKAGAIIDPWITS